MKNDELQDDLKPEYTKEQLGKGTRGRFYKSYQSGTNLVLLDPEVAKAFPDEKSVNDALKSLIKVAQASVQQSKVSGDNS
jgi:hypothetical protein